MNNILDKLPIGYYECTGVKISNDIKSIAKSPDRLQPIYEAYMNSLEALGLFDINNDVQYPSDKKIMLEFYFDALGSLEEDGVTKYENLSKVIVRDNGVGCFSGGNRRLLELRNDTKNEQKNKGTGRVQYIHYFASSKMNSVSEMPNGDKLLTDITFSKTQAFLNHQAFIKINDAFILEDKSTPTYTELTLSGIYKSVDNDYFKTLSAEELKNKLLRHFIHFFCTTKSRLPATSIAFYVGGDIDQEETITQADVPDIDTYEEFKVPFSIINDKQKVVKRRGAQISFGLTTIKMDSSILGKNEILLVNKEELVRQNIELTALGPTSNLNKSRYLFLLTSEYFQSVAMDDRGHLELLTRERFKKEYASEFTGDLFEETPTAILLEDITSHCNKKISKTYPEFEEVLTETGALIEEIQETFFISQATVDEAKEDIKPGATARQVIDAIYKAESKQKAKDDTELLRL